MILRSLLRLTIRASLLALAVASVAVGCSRQGEGERCDLTAAGNDDCDSGLVCVSCRNLEDHATDRCCPPNGGTDERCRLSGAEEECRTSVGSGGSGAAAGASGSGSAGTGRGGAGGTAGTAGSSSGGTAGEDDPAGAGGA